MVHIAMLPVVLREENPQLQNFAVASLLLAVETSEALFLGSPV